MNSSQSYLATRLRSIRGDRESSHANQTRSPAAIGLGSARWSLATRPDEDLARATLELAVELGVDLVDTAPAYTPPGHDSHSERLLARVMGDRFRDQTVLVSTKGGHGRNPDGTFWVDGRPSTLATQCEWSLRALGVDHIPLYSLHWPDPKVPVAESIGALEMMRQEGKVGLVGVCNIDAVALEHTVSSVAVDFVQGPMSVLDQSSADLARTCERLGVLFMAYSPLGGGRAAELGRSTGLSRVARRRDVSPFQVALAWVLAQRGVIPIVGAGRPASLREAIDATHIALESEELDVIRRSFPSDSQRR